jgi:hypothetical protein
MSYPGLTDLTDDEQATSGGLTLADAAGMAPEMRSIYAQMSANRAAGDKMMETKYYAPRRALYEQYGKELEARRAGPTAAERLYEMGAALMKPTATPGFGGMIANVAPVMAGQQKAMREARDARRDMLTKYKLDVGALEGEQLKSTIAGKNAVDTSVAAALKAMYTPKMVQVYNPETGQTEWRMLSPADLQPPKTPGAASESSAADVAHPKSKAEYDALPSGSLYTAPNGTTQRKS